MNYRHAFHAGNFADVLKHAVLARILVHLAQKPAAFRVIDTHAGIGRYDLAGPLAERTGEWRDGIGRLEAHPLAGEAAALLEPYLQAVRETRAFHGPTAYPGSPLIAAALTRAQDRLVFVEKHPEDVRRLTKTLDGDKRAKVIELDGWTALNAYVPPVEKRGLVLIDPPFEEPGEYERLAERLAKAWAKWRTGTYVAWFPVKDIRERDAFYEAVRDSGVAKVLRLEMLREPANDPTVLAGSGLLVVNPPWTLAAEMEKLGPPLSRLLARKGDGLFRCDWLVEEAQASRD
jgi:23S rRNA (adenine2030-N6)-methyltransferase